MVAPGVRLRLDDDPPELRIPLISPNDSALIPAAPFIIFSCPIIRLYWWTYYHAFLSSRIGIAWQWLSHGLGEGGDHDRIVHIERCVRGILPISTSKFKCIYKGFIRKRVNRNALEQLRAEGQSFHEFNRDVSERKGWRCQGDTHNVRGRMRVLLCYCEWKKIGWRSR